jgi:hypothetical protein
MATWSELKSYVHNTYKVSDEDENMLKLVFELPGLRTQVVLVWHLTLSGSGEEWIQIESPIGEVASVDLGAALDRVGSTVCGGLAKFGTLLTFRHSVPLGDLSIAEFESPLRLVTSTADNLEQALVGGDQY